MVFHVIRKCLLFLLCCLLLLLLLPLLTFLLSYFLPKLPHPLPLRCLLKIHTHRRRGRRERASIHFSHKKGRRRRKKRRNNTSFSLFFFLHASLQPPTPTSLPPIMTLFGIRQILRLFKSLSFNHGYLDKSRRHPNSPEIRGWADSCRILALLPLVFCPARVNYFVLLLFSCFFSGKRKEAPPPPPPS